MASQIEQEFRAIRIMGLALLMGVVMFLGIVLFVLHSGDQLDGGFSGGQGLQILSVICLAVAVVNTLASFPVRAARLRAIQDQPPSQRLPQYRGAVILALALCEGGALFGVVVILLNGLQVMPLVAVGVGVAGLLLHQPRRADVERLLGLGE